MMINHDIQLQENVLYMTPDKNFLNYLWEDWIEMVTGSLNIEQKIIDCTEWKLNWATKVRVWKGYYFCNWLRKNCPTLTSSPHWTTVKYWTPPFLFLLLEFQKIFPPINMSRLQSWFPPPPFRKGGRKLCISLAYRFQETWLLGLLSNY